MTDEFPQVYLIDYTRNPILKAGAVAAVYRGEFPTSLDQIDPEQAQKDWQEQFKTQLNAPLEFVRLTFALVGVPRAFTHQLVRTRIASYAQESLRFAFKGGDNFLYDIGPSIRGNDEAEKIYHHHMAKTKETYEKLAELGVQLEDARGVLPINIRTNIMMDVSYNVLLNMAGIRLCLQAQEIWRRVMMGIRQSLLDEPEIPDELAYALQPKCFYSGKCLFRASFDRRCPIDSRIKAGAEWKIEDFLDAQLKA